MQKTSKAYKTEQKNYLRNEQYINVYLGVISKEAQANATISGDFTVYSDEDAIFGNKNFEAYYGTAEENMSRCDRTQFFMPRDQSAFALYQGAVTQDIRGSVTFDFGQFTQLNIKGLTIDFGDFYPTEFIITNGWSSHTYTFYNDKPGKWTTENEFLNTDYITITPISMVGGQQRLRIFSILFGLGFLFDNTNLISTSWKSDVAHLSDILPSKSFSFTIDNLNKKFSADNPHSFVAFLEEQQEVEFEFGRKLDDGTIYKIPGGKLNLKSWSSNDTQAKFTAVGYMDYSSGTYDKGQYYPDGISLYDLAVAVCEDAGFENYVIDTYLKKVITHNPLPVEKHKNLLQLIANAGMAILREDRQGHIELRTSFEPDIINISSNGQTDYTNLDSLIHDDEQLEYATAEQNFVYPDSHQYFMPRNQEELFQAGYVSSMVSNENGQFLGTTDNYLRFIYDDGRIVGISFKDGVLDINRGMFYGDGISVSMNEDTTNNPCLTIKWDAAWTFYNLILYFPDVFPAEIMVRSYKDNALVEKYLVEDEISNNTIINHEFFDVDEIIIEFTKTNPYQRIHLGKVSFGDVTDYSIDYRDMSTSPTSTRTEFIKDVNVVYTEFSYGDEVKTLSTIQAQEGENVISYKTAYHDYSVAYKEIPDDIPSENESVTSVKVKYCDKLPSTYDAEYDTRYLLRDGDVLQMYILEKVDDVTDEWKFITNTRELVGDYDPSYPDRMQFNTIYVCAMTGRPYVYHLYYKEEVEQEEGIYYPDPPYNLLSFGIQVRGTLEIIDSGAYYVKFTSNAAEEVVVSGIAFNIAETTYTKALHEIGIDKTAKNVLIDNLEQAKTESQWLSDYYNNDVEYKISYRGEPALDPDDQIYIENKFVARNLIRVTSTQIDTSTGMSMSCSLTGRRISYVEAARVDYAIVDQSEVSE